MKKCFNACLLLWLCTWLVQIDAVVAGGKKLWGASLDTPDAVALDIAGTNATATNIGPAAGGHTVTFEGTTDLMVLNGVIDAADGNNTTPGYGFNGRPGWGMFHSGDALRFTVGGGSPSDALLMDDTRMISFVNIVIWDGDELQLGSGSDSRLRWDANQTNDAVQWSFGDTSNTALFVDTTHLAVNYGHANQSNPTTFWHANSSSTARWGSLAHDSTNFILATGAGNIRQEPAGGVVQVEPAGLATVGTFTNSEILDVSTDELTTGLIPAGAYNIRVNVRNTSAITGTTAVSYDVGIEGDDLDAFAAAVNFTDTTSTSSANWTAVVGWSASAREVRLTPNAGTLDTGTVQVVLFYDTMSAQIED